MAKIELRLSEILTERNMTQSKLSELSGVRPATISAMCRNNTAMLSLDLLAKIMYALDISDVGELVVYRQ